jgi:hypothetical protein
MVQPHDPNGLRREAMVDPIGPGIHVGASKARGSLSSLIDEVLGGRLRVIDRRRDSVVLIGTDEMERLLALAFPFAPEVYFGQGTVAVWLPELAVGGEGDDLEGAQEALLEGVIDYAATWEEELRRSPDHARRRGWVYRVQLAGTPERIRRMLFEDHEASELRPAPSLL